MELYQIRNQSRLRAFAVLEDDKQKIIDIFDNVERARKCLMVCRVVLFHCAALKLESRRLQQTTGFTRLLLAYDPSLMYALHLSFEEPSYLT